MAATMIDFFALALSHALLFIAAWQMMGRADLDQDPKAPEPAAPEPPKPAKPGLRLRA